MDINPMTSHAQQTSHQRLAVAEAFTTGASAVSRVAILINAALRVIESPDPKGGSVKLAFDLLQEAWYLSQDLIATLEAEARTAGEGK